MYANPWLYWNENTNLNLITFIKLHSVCVFELHHRMSTSIRLFCYMTLMNFIGMVCFMLESFKSVVDSVQFCQRWQIRTQTSKQSIESECFGK